MSGSLTLLLLHRYAQFSQALSSIKHEVKYFHALRNNNLHEYFNLLHVSKIDCILLLVFHKVLKLSRCLIMNMDSDVHGALTGRNCGHPDLTVYLMGNQLSLMAILKVT